ncbi:MAG: hypothetical protein KYX68_11655 [Flavobacterium sp.]|nr:hypothetical protein [Flavobacterium sp.]
MKHIFFFLITLSIYAQDTIPATKSVIALDKMNVVYRGIPNPISIAVNDAKSFKVYGNGVKQDDKGNYTLAPGSGLTTKVYVEITKNDDTVVVEEHEFKIKGIPQLIGTFNNNFSIDGTIVEFRENFLDAEIGIEMLEFYWEFRPSVISFNVSYKNKIVNIIGNKINDEAYNLIKKAKKNSFIIISDIMYPHSPESLPKKVVPILIKLEN